MLCVALSMRSLTCSYAATSPVNCTPTCSSAGRPAQNRSSTTHWMKSSANTGSWSSMPVSAFSRATSSGVTAGVMRSTMQLGKVALASIQAASSGSRAPANASTARRDDVAIVAEIVAGQHRERRQAVRPPLGQGGDDEAEHGPGRLGMGEVVRDVRRIEAELARRLVEIVAALGDRHRDDADRRVVQPRQHGARGRPARTGTRRWRRRRCWKARPWAGTGSACRARPARPCLRPWRARPGCRSGRRRRCPSLPGPAVPGTGRHRPPDARGGSCRR